MEQSLLSDKNLEGLYAVAHTLYTNGQYEKARDFFRFLTLAHGGCAKYWKGLAACYQQLNKYNDALDFWSIAALLDPKDYTIHIHAAHCFFLEKDIKSAAKALLAAELICEGEKKILAQIELLKDLWKIKTIAKDRKRN